NMHKDMLITNGFTNFDILNGHFIFVFTGDFPSDTITDHVTRVTDSARAFPKAVFLFLSAAKTQAYVPYALKPGQVQKAYDVSNSLKVPGLVQINQERSVKIDLQRKPVKVLVCPICNPTDKPKVSSPLIFVFGEFISFINATPEYETVFAEISSADWVDPLIDGTAAMSMPLILDDVVINYHPSSMNFFLGIIFVTALPKTREYSSIVQLCHPFSPVVWTMTLAFVMVLYAVLEFILYFKKHINTVKVHSGGNLKFRE
ncbi:unnamed protein product, partial [Allacma fusca]